MTLLSIGDRITDTLVIDRLLGEGAFAEVHRVRHEHLGWQAMKLFKRVASRKETHAMLDEARLLSTLGHPLHRKGFRRQHRTNTRGAPRLLHDGVRRRWKPRTPRGSTSSSRADGARGRGRRADRERLAIAHDQEPPIVHRDLSLANILVGYLRMRRTIVR